MPRGLPVGALLADDPAQARGVPGRVRRVRPGTVARFGGRDVRRLLADASIVRHRGKIEATIANARATVALRETDAPLVRAVLGAPRRRVRAVRHPTSIGRRRPPSRQLSPRRCAGGLPIRRPDDRLRRDAGVRRRQRPHPPLLRPGSRRSRASIRPDRSAMVSAIRGKEVVRRWRLQVRAVEVPARRGVSPGPEPGIV